MSDNLPLTETKKEKSGKEAESEKSESKPPVTTSEPHASHGKAEKIGKPKKKRKSRSVADISGVDSSRKTSANKAPVKRGSGLGGSTESSLFPSRRSFSTTQIGPAHSEEIGKRPSKRERDCGCSKRRYSEDTKGNSKGGEDKGKRKHSIDKQSGEVLTDTPSSGSPVTPHFIHGVEKKGVLAEGREYGARQTHPQVDEGDKGEKVPHGFQKKRKSLKSIHIRSFRSRAQTVFLPSPGKSPGKERPVFGQLSHSPPNIPGGSSSSSSSSSCRVGLEEKGFIVRGRSNTRGSVRIEFQSDVLDRDRVIADLLQSHPPSSATAKKRSQHSRSHSSASSSASQSSLTGKGSASLAESASTPNIVPLGTEKKGKRKAREKEKKEKEKKKRASGEKMDQEGKVAHDMKESQGPGEDVKIVIRDSDEAAIEHVRTLLQRTERKLEMDMEELERVEETAARLRASIEEGQVIHVCYHRGC